MEFFELDDLTVFCSKPPACVMFRPDNPKHPGFEGLNQDIFPIFRIERFIQINGFSIRRKQVPMCPAFCLADYKVQSKTKPLSTSKMTDTLEGKIRIENSAPGTPLGMACTFYGKSRRRILLSVPTLI